MRLDAPEENDQFGWIVTDYDVSDLLNYVAVPQTVSLSEAHKTVLTKVINEKKERARCLTTGCRRHLLARLNRNGERCCPNS